MTTCACKDGEIIIYGAGAVSDILYLRLEALGMADRLRCFAVTKMGGNPKEKHGLPVVEARELEGSLEGAVALIAVQPALQDEVERTLRLLSCGRIVRTDAKRLVDELYAGLHRFPIQQNKLLFLNMNGMGYGGNPKYIAQELLTRDREGRLDLVWAVSGEGHRFPPGIRVVRMGTMDYYRELATSRIWIDNARKGFDARKRDGQYYIQTWHGAMPGKKVERDAAAALPAEYVANAKRDSRMVDLFISGSEFYTELYKKSFWFQGEIFCAGLPRQDVFFHGGGIREKVCRYYQIPDDNALLLYAPTFRRDFGRQFYDLDFPVVVRTLEERFGRKFVCAVSKHPNNRNMEYGFDESHCLIPVDAYDDFEELLAAADVLITDYSGCMYDFSFTGRPVFLYQKDYWEYKDDRGFYVPMEGLPYPRAISNEGLVKEIRKFRQEEYQEKLCRFMDGMGNYDRGDASKRVADRIMEVLGMTGR